jgi:hypothetical protein
LRANRAARANLPTAREDILIIAFTYRSRRAGVDGRSFRELRGVVSCAADPICVVVLRCRSVVRHDFDGRARTLFALFKNGTPTVRQVEAMLAQNGLKRLIGRVLRYPLAVE